MESPKTICLITNWYPTEENPYAGLFFREQALAMGGYLNFIVVHIVEQNGWFPFLHFTDAGKKRGVPVRTEENIREYTFHVNVPIRLAVRDVLCTLYHKFTGKNAVPGVGRYLSNAHRKAKKRIAAKIFRNYLQDEIDVMYCVDAQNEAPMLRYAAECRGVPYILGEHAPFPWPGTVISNEIRNAIEEADLFLAISQDKIRQVLLQNIRLKHIAYVGNLVDETNFHLTTGGGGAEGKVFLVVAAHSFYKNYDLLIRVFNRLTKMAVHPFQVVIAGYASNKGYSQGIEVFEEQIRRSDFHDRVRMIPSCPHDQIHELYEKADAFVMTSIQEGQPVSAMEASCSGLPVFTTRCGGVEDYITDKNGRVYDILDEKGMAEGLNDFLNGTITFDSKYIRRNMIQMFGRKAFVGRFVKAVYETCGRYKEEHT